MRLGFISSKLVHVLCSMFQVRGHRTVSLFSGCLGLEMGWKPLGPQLSQFGQLQNQPVFSHLIQSSLRFTRPLCYVRGLVCEKMSQHVALQNTEVEADPFCQRIIEQRGKEGFVPQVPIFPDICTLKMADVAELGEDPEGFLGGFPCQARA